VSLIVDLHNHFIPPDLPDFASQTGDPRWPRLVVDTDEAQTASIYRGSELFRVVRAPCWRPEARLREMDEGGVAVDVMSPIPVSLTYWAESALGLQFARHINDWLAQVVQESGGRIKGLGTVPLQDPGAAVVEMQRAMGLGLSGLELGTVVDGLEFSAEELRPFFRAAADAGVPLFVHPIDGDCATRATSPMERFAIGMHTDSALAISALVFGGVLEDARGLRVCISHGGGAFPWTYPRLRQGALRMRPPADADYDELVASLWTDALVFDPQHLALLDLRFGFGHLVYGTDYPFLPRDLPPGSIFDEATELGICTERQAAEMKGPNALRFLSIDT
jgi:aminocarboxymuconate-semialdehyde decarboxylase